MKVLLLISLLVICGAQAKPSTDVNRLNIHGYLENLINTVFDHAVSGLQDIQNGINNIIDKIIGTLSDIEKKTTASMANINKFIDDQTKNLELIGNCVTQQSDAIQSVTTEAQSDIDACGRNASIQLEAVHQAVTDHRNAILDEIKSIHNTISGCYSINPIKWIRCVEDNSVGLTDSIDEIVEIAQDGISIAASQIAVINETTELCLATAHNKATVQIQVIIEKIRECIMNNNQSTVSPAF